MAWATASATCGAMEKLGSPDSKRITRLPAAWARSRPSRICTIFPKEIASRGWAGSGSFTADDIVLLSSSEGGNKKARQRGGWRARRNRILQSSHLTSAPFAELAVFGFEAGFGGVHDSGRWHYEFSTL